MSLNKNNLRAHVVKHVHGFHTGETVGYIVDYWIQWDYIIASMPKSPEQNHQPSKSVNLFEDFVLFSCLFDFVYSTIIIFYIIKIIPPAHMNIMGCFAHVITYNYNYTFIKQSVNKFVQYMYVNCSSIHTFPM